MITITNIDTTLTLPELHLLEKVLKSQVLATLSSYITPDNSSIKAVGSFLCGINWELAKEPYSDNFLNNVEYNGVESIPLIHYVQVKYLIKRKIESKRELIDAHINYVNPIYQWGHILVCAAIIENRITTMDEYIKACDAQGISHYSKRAEMLFK